MMAKPSVVFINRVYPPAKGASGRVLRDVAREMAKAGWAVTVLTTGPEKGSEKDGGIIVHKVKSPENVRGILAYMIVWYRLFRAALKLPRRDLVITLTDPPMLIVIGRLYARAKKTSHMHWCHDLYPDLFPVIGSKFPDFMLKTMRKVTRRSMNRSGKVIVVGRCMARHLAHTGVETSRISMIPNWSDAEIMDKNRRPRQSDVRLKDNVCLTRPPETLLRDDSPRFRILYSGNIGRAHPMGAILDAAEELSIYPEIEFVFVGEGPNHEKLAQERARRGLENIKLMPFQPLSLLKELMESGDIHLVSMRNNASGLLVPCKFYSALSAGRPTILIGPAESEVGRVIKDYACGAIVPPGDGKTLAQAILYFRLDPNAWYDAQQGAQKAGLAFSPDKAIRSLIKEAESVARNRVA